MLTSATPFRFKVGTTASQDSKWLEVRYEASCVRIARAFSDFRAEGIEPILIKGWAAARYYPKPSERPFSDIDLCVSGGDLVRAKTLLTERDIGAAIDLHDGFRHLDSLSWQSLFARSVLVRLNEVDVRLLRDEDHLRILAAHWLNDGGTKAERLDDLYYTVSNSVDAFDWNLCLADVPIHRRGWIAKAIAAGIKYRGHSYHYLPFTDKELALPAWFTRALDREWGSEPLYPLYYLLGQPRRFLKQLSKRFPPNPIQATIESDAPIDDSPRLGFQARTFLRRIPLGFRMQLHALRNIIR